MMTGMNGILEAIQAGEIHSVNAHIMTVENKNGQSFEHMIEDEKIQYCSYVYHLEQLEVRSFNQILSTLVSFLPKETSHIQLSQGRLPQQTYEILITESLYQKLSHNQTLNFVFQDQQYSMNIVGIVKQELFQNDEIYCLQSFQNHVNELKDEFTLCVEAKVNQGRKLYQNLSQKYIPYSEVFERSDSYQSLLSLARMVAYVFIGVSGIISLILIRIVLSILYYERKHDVAYLLSLGITHTRFRCLSLLESLFLGIVIAGGGCILSAIFYEYINHVFHIEKLLLFSFVLKPLWQSDFDLYILIILMYMMMCIIGTLKPLKTVLKTNVVDILREE